MEENEVNELSLAPEVFAAMLDYISSAQSLEQVAYKHQVSLSKIKYYSTCYNFTQKRNDFRETINRELLAVRANEQLDEIINFHKRAKSTNDKLSEMITKLIEKLEYHIDNTINLEKISTNQLVSLLNKCSLILTSTTSNQAQLLGVSELLKLLESNKPKITF